DHRRRTGAWPRQRSDSVLAAPGETWLGIHTALAKGLRQLPGGTSLAKVLAKHRGVRNEKDVPLLTERKILGWAKGYRRRFGRWPKKLGGPIADAPGETWRAVDTALHNG